MGFGIIAYVSNTLVTRGRKLGRSFGYQMAVKQSSHSLETKMVDPSSNEYAWDPDLFKRGNLFVEGHANPVKLNVNYDPDLETPNEIDVATRDTDEDAHVSVISSPRYREYMRQDLISQLLNPTEQWRKILYAVIATAAISLLSMMFAASSAGMF